MSPTGRDGDGDDERADGDDDSAFAEAMRAARPLARGHERITGPQPVATQHRTRVVTPAPSRFVVEQTGDAITGRAPDVAAKLCKELRGGAHAVDARLDLHGHGRQTALHDLERFVASAAARGARCLLVIHGRGHGSDTGGPVLRPAIWEWLASSTAERAGVMAFVSARPADGGDGATLVLLRRAERR
jgi:DNA-nicking Smr family endonuclease